MQKKQKTTVQSTGSIVALGKSKRLAAMRKTIEVRVETQESKNKFVVNKKETEIQQARAAIKQSIVKIKATYPQGRQNKLFALRYGSDEKINQMSLQKLYLLLGIKQTLPKEIAGIGFEGSE